MTTNDQPGIVLEDDGSRGRYVMRADGAEALLTFARVGKTQLIIDHTEVPVALRGQGIGAKLVERAVEDARREGVKVVPMCPFARAQFERNPEWADVLASRGQTG